MNARIIKETRSVLPVLGVTMLASVAPRLIWDRDVAGGAGLAFFALCCVMMGAACFGNEYQWRTMPLLLAQPVPRRKIWHEKMFILAVALALGLAFFLLCVPVDKDSYPFLVLVPFCVFAVAPYMALRVQNTFLAAVLTFGMPYGICGLLALMWWIFAWFFPEPGRALDESIQQHANGYAMVATTIYCGICYWLGYRAFLRLEAVPPQSKELKLPGGIEAALAGRLNRLMPGYRGPWTSLLRKELRIQKYAFVFAAIMGFSSLLIALVRDLDRSADHAEFLTAMTIMPIVVLAFVIPFITSGGCVAEERNWGVSTWQRALPVSSRKQWAAKMAVVIFTCVLLGIVLPLGLWVAYGWVFHLPTGPGPIHWDQFKMPTSTELYWITLAGMTWVLGYLLWLSLGVFVSSLCANSAKAVILNLGLLAGGAGLVVGTISWIIRVLDISPSAEHGAELIFSILAVYFTGLLGLTQFLAYRNHRRGEPDTRRVWAQLVTVTGAIVAGAALGFVLWWDYSVVPPALPPAVQTHISRH